MSGDRAKAERVATRDMTAQEWQKLLARSWLAFFNNGQASVFDGLQMALRSGRGVRVTGGYSSTGFVADFFRFWLRCGPLMRACAGPQCRSP